MLPIESGEKESEEKVRHYALIKNTMMLKKLDGKVALMSAILWLGLLLHNPKHKDNHHHHNTQEEGLQPLAIII